MEALLERARLLRGWRTLAEKAARAAKEARPDAQVYLAGSTARGEEIAASDIDLVIVLPREPTPREAAEIIQHIHDALKLPPLHPLEIHVTGPQGLKRYTRKGPLKRLL